MSDDDDYIDDVSGSIPCYGDVAAQRAQALQYLLIAADNLKDEAGKEIARKMATALVASVDPKAPAVRVVK